MFKKQSGFEVGREAQTPSPSEPIERNRPGSPYVEVDLQQPDVIQKIGAYYIDLQIQYGHWLETKAPWRAPERGAEATEIELMLLQTLVRNGGKINFWDASIDIPEARTPNPIDYSDACERFTHCLGLEVQQEQ